MQFRRPIPLLLLLASPCLVAAKDTLTNEEIRDLNHAKPREAAAGQDGAKATQSARRYVGTEDAPVDGLDGKPHAGPFVDISPEQTGSATVSVTATAKKALPTLLEKFADEGADIPEKNDGVMNDEGRVKPKKGTTGTEGGVSEKDKAKLAKGGNVENKPQSPAEAPLPHGDEEHTDSKGEKSEKAIKEEKDADAEYNAGLEKPTDLPDKPHNIPHPAGGSSSKDGASPGEPWLQDTMPYSEGSTNPKRPTSGSASEPLPIGGTTDDHETWHEWFHSFVVSFTMIIFTEIGDKTFLVAALMAMRHDRLVVFTAALAALGLMTVLSAVLGHIAPTLLPKRLTTFAAALLFLFFGAKMLREGLEMDHEAGVGEEMREVEQELEEKEHDLARRDRKNSNPHSLESGRLPSRSPSPSKGGHSHGAGAGGLTNLFSLILSPAWVQTFVMTFLGEWGDRSQIATIAMAAGQDYWWVTLGAISGHACCTGLAVVGGRALAGRVSMRVVTIGGACAFLVFGVLYLWEAYFED